jgi:putative tryptophan/tyrosine transport system substrate-binding protein
MRRREFIGLLGGGAAVWPLAAQAQRSAMPVVGFANGQSLSTFAYLVKAFREGLSQNGFVEGQSVSIVYRWAEADESRMPALIDELVRKPVDVVVIGGSGQGTLAAKNIPPNVPVVVSDGDDPVRQGLVASLNRPGGNLTVVMVYSTTLEAKRLEILHRLLPRAELIGVLVDPTFPPTKAQVEELHAAAVAQHVQIRVFNASTEPELDTAFAELAKADVGAVAMVGNPFFNNSRNRLVELSARYALPSMFEIRQFAEAGGLVSYGPSISEVYRQLGVYAGRILKGDKAGDLPVMQPSKFDFVINLKTAKSLGVTVPTDLLATADDRIDLATSACDTERPSAMSPFWTLGAERTSPPRAKSVLMTSPVPGLSLLCCTMSLLMC